MCSGAIYWAGIPRVVYGCSEEVLYSLTGAHEDNPVSAVCVGIPLSVPLRHQQWRLSQTFLLPCRKVFAHGQRPVSVVGPLCEEEARTVHVGFWVKEEAAPEGDASAEHK